MELKKYLKKTAEAVEKVLKEALPHGSHGERVVRAASYSLFAGGKKVRPALCLAGCEAVGGDSSKIIWFAAGIECLHTYSLIHDDLPCMDNDDLRRGKPSCHKAFDEATAVLAGDGLQAFAFELFTHPELIKNISPKRLLKAIRIISKAVGFEGMVGGQMVDLLMEGKKGNLKILKWIHLHKTVKLIEASVVCGGILGGGKSRHIKALSKYGKNLGLAFQVIDDLLDVTGDEKKIGKRVHSDLKKGKLTYPGLIGIEKSKKVAKKYTEKAITALEPFGGKASILKELAYFVLNRAF